MAKLERLSTTFIDEDARKSSVRKRHHHHWDLIGAWADHRGVDLTITETLDDQLCCYLKEQFLDKKGREFAVEAIAAVKFSVPAELGRGPLWRARRAAALWDSGCGPFLEETTAAAAAKCLASPSILSRLLYYLGLPRLLDMRRVSAAAPAAVRYVLERAACSRHPERPQNLQSLLLSFKADLARRVSAGYVGVRLVVRDSPGLLQLEASGCAAFQVDGHVSLRGTDLGSFKGSTLGYWFAKCSTLTREWGEHTTGWSPDAGAIDLLPDSNLDSAHLQQAADPDIAESVKRVDATFREFLDPCCPEDVWRLLNPGVLSTICMLLPDAKYDVALISRQFDPYDTSAPYKFENEFKFKMICGRPDSCYVSLPAGGGVKGTTLLRTQSFLDESCVLQYCSQLRAASGSRPTALVLDYFVQSCLQRPHAEAPPPEEAQDSASDTDLNKKFEHSSYFSPQPVAGWLPQMRRAEAANPLYQTGHFERIWLLLDGHHKVEAAARVGCAINFLVLAASAQPYSPMIEGHAASTDLTASLAFPWLIPSAEPVKAEWPEAEGCSHYPWLLGKRWGKQGKPCDKCAREADEAKKAAEALE